MSESTCPGLACIDGPTVDGLCLEHYIETLLPRVAAFRPGARVDPVIRFLGYTDRSGGPDACWPWTCTIHPKTGYGQIFAEGKLQPAHRWAYKYFIGPILDGLEIDHTCHTKACPTPGDGDPHRGCANPRHLEAVTRAVNIQRSTAPEATVAYYQENVTECPQGHPYDEANTQWRTTKDGYQSRRCAQCNRDGTAAWKAARRAANPPKPRVLPDRCKRGHLYTEENTRIKIRNGKRKRECRTCDREDAAIKRAELKALTGLTHPSRARKRTDANPAALEQGALWDDVA